MFKFYDEIPGDQKGLFWSIVVVVVVFFVGFIFLAAGIISEFT